MPANTVGEHSNEHILIAEDYQYGTFSNFSNFRVQSTLSWTLCKIFLAPRALTGRICPKRFD